MMKNVPIFNRKFYKKLQLFHRRVICMNATNGKSLMNVYLLCHQAVSEEQELEELFFFARTNSNFKGDNVSIRSNGLILKRSFLFPFPLFAVKAIVSCCLSTCWVKRIIYYYDNINWIFMKKKHESKTNCTLRQQGLFFPRIWQEQTKARMAFLLRKILNLEDVSVNHTLLSALI